MRCGHAAGQGPSAQQRGRRRQQLGVRQRRWLVSSQACARGGAAQLAAGQRAASRYIGARGCGRWPAASRRWRSRGPHSCAGRRLTQPASARSFELRRRGAAAAAMLRLRAAEPQQQQRHPVAPPPGGGATPCWRVRHVAAHAVLFRARAVRTGGRITHYGRHGAAPSQTRRRMAARPAVRGQRRRRRAPQWCAPGAEQGCSSAASGKKRAPRPESSSLPSSLLGASRSARGFVFLPVLL